MSLNDFEIIKQIGSGAFSTVSLVKRKKDNTIYALKRVELSKMKQNEKDNSLNEIRLLASVNHVNIIAYKESFYEESSNTLNIILEYADGGDLQSKISAHKNIKKYFNEKTIWSIFIQMVYGIRELHNRNIIHRDLKSANIFLMKNGICKLGDLNVSKEAKAGLLKTQTGTPYFASPEVWGGKPYGLKSDIWSLGCILYQMTTLKMPFQGNNFKEVYHNVSKCKYQPLPKIYSNELDLIINKLLQIDPEKRPNCQQILDDPIIIEKIKYLFNTNIYNDINNEEKKEIDESNDIIEKINNDLKKEKNNKISKKFNHTSRLLKTLKCNKNDDINDLLPKNNNYKIYNNYRIFKNYGTNPSSTQEEKESEKDIKVYNDKNINIGYNKKFYNKSIINKYKTINSNFLKQKKNLNKNMEKSDSISKIINKENSTYYINHRSEGNSNSKMKNNEKEKERERERDKSKNNNQIKIPLLEIKNKPELLKPNNNSIPRNCISAKNRRKALSETKNNNLNLKYHNNNNQKLNIKNSNNYQYKKITPLNTNSNNENNNSIINNTQKKRLSDIVGYGYEYNQTDNDNKETNNTSEKGKSFTYNNKLENKFHFNLSCKPKSKNSHSLSKNKKENKYFEEINENTYNKKLRKSIPNGRSTNKNTSAIGIDCYPVKPNIKVSNLFKENFNDFNSKLNSYISNKFNNNLHYTLNKKEVRRNNSTFQINNKEKQKILTLHKLSCKNNCSSNRLDIDLNTLSKDKYPIVGEKLTLPSTKGSESVSIKNHKHNISHKKIFKKNINNINIECNHIEKDYENNIYNYNNTASNRINIFRRNNDNNDSKNNDNSINCKNINTNIHKSISLVSINRPGINITQTNKSIMNKKINKYNNEFSRDNSDSIHSKISNFKFEEFKKKRLKNTNNFIERKNKLLKFNHVPFINTPSKENEHILTKQKEEEHSTYNQIKNKDEIDPSIKMLINPIKIIEKRNFKRKLFPVHPQVKINKLNILNNTSYKNNNKDFIPSIQED